MRRSGCALERRSEHSWVQTCASVRETAWTLARLLEPSLGPRSPTLPSARSMELPSALSSVQKKVQKKVLMLEHLSAARVDT